MRPTARIPGWPAAAGAAVVLTLLSGCAPYFGCRLGNCQQDNVIRVQFYARAQEHPALQPPNTVRVRVINGVVHLYGRVASEAARSEAESVARSIPGVHQVFDHIHYPDQDR